MNFLTTDLKQRLPWLFVAVFMSALCLRLIVYTSHEPRMASDSWRLLVWCILPFAWLMLVERRPLASALRPVATRSRPWALVAATVLIGVIVAGYRLTFGHWTGIPPGRAWVDYAAIVPSILLVGVAEEFVFRGVLLSGLIRANWQPLKAHLAVNAMFAASHYPGWLAGSGSMSAMDWLTASLRLFVFGMAMSGLVELEGGLVLAILVHTINDAWVGLFMT